MALDRTAIAAQFARAVNMDADELGAWPETPESRRVGYKAAGASESAGHASGRRIVALLRADGTPPSDDDYAHMRKVVGFVARHRAQEPEKKVTSRWRYSLMN